MTLLRFDGFAFDDLSTRWLLSGSINTETSSPRFTSDRYVAIGGSFQTFSCFVTASAEVYVGVAMQIVSGSSMISFYGDSGATRHLTISFSAAGAIEVRRSHDAGPIIASAPAGSFSNGWNFFEVRATIADSGGIVQVRINGSTTNVINYSGDTRNGGTSTDIDYVQFGSLGGSTTLRFDDVYILNALGSAPHNTWLGDVRVYTLSPNGNGNSSQFTGSDGNSTDNYLLVDELPPSTADYVGSGTVGHKDLYTLANLPSGVGTIFGTNELLRAAKTDAGTASIKHLLRTGGTNYNGAATSALSTSYSTYVNLRTVNPGTSSAWTASEIDALEIGVENA